MQQFQGRLVKKIFGAGSKSEHEGIFLVTGDKEYLVRRRGGNPFEMDPQLESQVGMDVSCLGDVYDYILYLDQCDRADR